MPKKFKIEQKRVWLSRHEELSHTEKRIAAHYKCDVRTVIKGIEEARREREANAARIELIKDKIGEHQKELLIVLDNIVSMLELPPYNLDIRKERNGRIAPIPLPGALVKPNDENELILVIHDENSLRWELLEEHLKGDKLWRMIKKWRIPFLEHIKARVNLLDAAQTVLKKESGLELIKKVDTLPETGGIFPVAVQVFYELSIHQALGIKDETNLEERLVATPDGYVRNGPGGTEFAYVPRLRERCRKNILAALNKLQSSTEKEQVILSYAVAGKITKETRRIAEEISLMRWLPSRCRVCKRMGV